MSHGKLFIIGLLITLVLFCLAYLVHASGHGVAMFIAQSVVDNAIFCIMFIIVVVVTGISC